MRSSGSILSQIPAAALTTALFFASHGAASAQTVMQQPTSPVTVTISPAYSAIIPSQALQFTASVNGSTNTTVTWQVNNVNGGSSSIGTVTSSGLFTAPPAVPSPATVTVTAVSQAAPTASATATLSVVAQLATGATYYVSTTGNDTNPGTITQPWRTIQHAANSVAAGDTVYVRAGVYNETVRFPNSGSASAGFITFSSYPGELATLDGTGLSIPGGMWGLFTIESQSYIVINGFEVRNYKTGSTANVPLGVYIFGAGSNLQIINNHIHDIVTTAKGCAANAFGMTVYGTEAPESVNALAISGNEIDHNTTGCSETLSVDGNVENFSIASNLVHDNNNIGIDAIGFERVCPNPQYDQARDGEIRGNTVYNISSYGNPAYGNQYAADGIYVDGGTQITIEQNLMHNDDLGIELASEHFGHDTNYVTARNNVIYSDNSNGISIGGYASNVGGTDHCTIVNNTLYGDDAKNTGSGEFQIQYHATGNVFENNIAYATQRALFLNNFTRTPPNPATIDYNLYYSTVGASNGLWVWQGKTYAGYSNYLSGTGLDKHSPPFSNPQFISLGNPPDLDIQPTSPAVNAGTNLGSQIVGSVDFAGNPRVQNGEINIGAYEQ